MLWMLLLILASNGTRLKWMEKNSLKLNEKNENGVYIFTATKNVNICLKGY